jgi:GNAT superfamily N-acetyltransferase
MRYALWPDCSPERHQLEIQQLIGKVAQASCLPTPTARVESAVGLTAQATEKMQTPALDRQDTCPTPAPENSGVVLVAERENGLLSGFAELSIRHDHVTGTTSVPVAYLEGWYVDPDVRGVGIGRRLLEAAEHWAVTRGLKELASDAELENAESIQAHRSCGFIETCRAVHFVKRLDVAPA